jgi:3-phosphoshikimate 1-carboxyvinyltransferase
VRVTGLAGAWDQPDGAVLDALAAMGATVTRLGPGGAPTGGTAVGAADTDADIDVVEVVGPERLAPVDLDLTATPDQLPNLAVLAALADGPSSFTGIEVTRHHETDRVASLRAELAKLGVRTDDVDGTLVVHGGGPLRPARLETHHDHRLAMAFAGLGCRLPGVEIADADCVSKTYPGFWRALAGLGSRWASTGET